MKLGTILGAALRLISHIHNIQLFANSTDEMTSIFTLPSSCNFSRWGWSKLRVMLQSCKVQSRRKQISPLLVCRRGFIVNLAKGFFFGLDFKYFLHMVQGKSYKKKNKQNIKRVAKNSEFVNAWLTCENFWKPWHGGGQGGTKNSW